ncbi:MAG: O-antigen ligase [Cyanobacteria bacterium J06598_3]
MLLLQKLPEQIFCVLTLLFYSGGIAPFISETHPVAPLMAALPHVAAGITFLLLTIRWQASLVTVFRTPLLWLLVLVAALSPFWSTIPSQTLGEIASLLRVTLFSLYLASRYDLKALLQLLGGALGIATALSFVFGALLPSYGVMGLGYIGQSQDWTHEGAWRGIYVHKVMLGTMMSFAILVSAYLSSWKNPLRPLALVTIAIAAITLIMSTTKAALAAMVLVFLCIPLYRSLRWRASRVLLFWSVTVPLLFGAALGAWASANAVLAALGKDITLSGRTEFWPFILENIAQRPWLGYGYHTFWLNGWEGYAANVWVHLPRGFEPPHAHNGFLDILLSLGWVGFGIFLAGFIRFGWRAFRWARTHPTAEGLVPLLFMTFMVLVNLTESVWLGDDLMWVCYSTLGLVIAKQQQPQDDWESDIEGPWEIYARLESGDVADHDLRQQPAFVTNSPS